MSLLHAVGSGGAGAEVLYPEDVFSTYLYTGNDSTQTINNGIDLAGKGGLVWIKDRGATGQNHNLVDTVRGATKQLNTNNTGAQVTDIYGITGFTSSGWQMNTAYNSGYNGPGYNLASWTFRKAPKFFDVVTYTGNGVAGRQIPHNLGCEVGMVVVKRLDLSSGWNTRHRSATGELYLNNIDAQLDQFYFITGASSTTFTLGSNGDVNWDGATYVAYLFAHDTSTDGIIQCGSFSGSTTVTIGWEPQYIMIKRTDSTGDWITIDSMRGCSVGGVDAMLMPNLSNAESVSYDYIDFTPTGFIGKNLTDTYIYMVIRRPMKVPTSGAEVFQPIVYTGTNVDNRLVNTGIVTDMVMVRERNDTTPLGMAIASRLTGNARLQTSSTAAEITDADSFMTPTVGYGNSFSAMNGFGVGNDATCKVNIDTTANNHIALAFKRAKGFFDVVCYAGTGVQMAVNHNLGVVPELMIVKMRNATGYDFMVYVDELGATKNLRLRSTIATEIESTIWDNTAPSEHVFTVGTSFNVNQGGRDYIAYLFATLAGISKVGSYIGNGTSQTIPCGFSTGARFILVKRTDSNGDWYIWDTARGVIAANDPHLSLNTTSAEVTTDDSVDPAIEGFICNQNTATNINVNGASYIFLAVS